jgi:hypothetical protein
MQSIVFKLGFYGEDVLKLDHIYPKMDQKIYNIFTFCSEGKRR